MLTATEQTRSAQAAEMADVFEEVLRQTPVRLPERGLLAGPAHLDWQAAKKALGKPVGPGGDNFHFPMNGHNLLRLGFSGIAQAAAENAKGLVEDSEEASYLRQIARCHHAACGFVLRHAQAAKEACGGATSKDERARLRTIARTCQAVGTRAPKTFLEAVQLFAFAWNIRGHGTIGRLDQYLYPFYKAGRAAGRLSESSALELLCELWECFNRAGSGDTLQNLMVGGQDRQGRDATNELSFLMCDAALRVRKTEPHFNARISAQTPPAFLEKLAAVQLMGHGQGTLYHDEPLIPELVKVGVPLELARDYSNDGCTEVVIDGASGIGFRQIEALKALELALFNGQENVFPGEPKGRYITKAHAERPLKTGCDLGFASGDFTRMTSYEEFHAAFFRQFFHQLDVAMAGFCRNIEDQRGNGVSHPFLAGTFPHSLRTGCDLFRGGFEAPCFMIFSGSLPTVADGLAAVQKVVFEDRFCTPAELLAALRANFAGHEELRQRCLRAPKFGNDDDRVDNIAAELAKAFCERVTKHPTSWGKPLWPALYNFLFNDQTKTVGATPDGRRWGEPMAEHFSPTPGRARRGPTAVICSAAKAPLGQACGSSIFHVSLSRSLAPENENGRRLLEQLLRAAMKRGVAVMNIAIYDVAALREARQQPEKHEDLIVRVWGFCARFVELSADMQEHIIQRAIAGD